MVCFQTKIQIWVYFGGQCKIMVYVMDTWSILRSFVTYILWTFGKVRGNLV
jgi:hypothetical protein